MSAKVQMTIAICVLLGFIAVMGTIVSYNRVEAETKRACIESGKQWIGPNLSLIHI